MVIIQYSHDRQKWFDFGADAVKSAQIFSLEEGEWIFAYIHKNYFGLHHWLRMVSFDNKVVLKEVSMHEDLIPSPLPID